MPLNLENMVYLASNLFRTFVIYQFMRVFFPKSQKRVAEVLCYCAYFLLNSAIFFIWHRPVFTLIGNIVLLFLLTLLYKGRIKSRLLAVAVIYAAHILIEGLVNGVMDTTALTSHMMSAAVTFITSLVLFGLSQVLRNFSGLQQSTIVPFGQWAAVIAYPVICIYATIVLVLPSLRENQMAVAVCLILFLLLNLFSTFIYDTLKNRYAYENEKALLKLQNHAYLKQYELICQAQETTRIMRHDRNNQIAVMQAYLDKGDCDSAKKFLAQIGDVVYKEERVARSGNFIIDSILNYKLQQAHGNGIQVVMDLQVPTELNILQLDMTAILSNLLDNAIEAVGCVKADRTIRLSIALDKNILYIQVANPYSGCIHDELATLKEDRFLHGLGLASVRAAVEKYDGMLKTDHTENEFFVEALLYNRVATK